MLAIHHILHPTDFSACSQAAFGMACALARDHNARLTVLHVAPRSALIFSEGVIPPEPEDLFEKLNEQLQAIESPEFLLPIDKRLVEGDPTAEIVRVAKEIDADLIIMGTHGRTGLDRFLLGSVAEETVRQAPCPVLTMKSPFAGTLPWIHREIEEPVAV